MTTLPPRRTPYFVAGGTLGPHIPSYVKRPSDDELFEHVMMGELCYVLTPRQMGKSSLVARTIVRLKNENIAAANVDLQDSGGLDEDTFYLNILDELRRAFELDVAVEDWWDENGRLGASLRFRRFFTDHLLPQVNNRVVIFIDEIDTMLTMPFRDNFFAAIRSLYNGRSDNPELERLSFVLLGVASPSELIKDPDRTPFNIGAKINLQEFKPTDVEPLLKGLEKEHPQQAKAILERIFHWTSGHPFLTQKLCLLISQTPGYAWHDATIDALVRQTFLSDEARNEDNIKLIQSRISASPNKRRLLRLYRQVYRGRVIKENKASIEQNQLLLSGLVSLTDGQLQVRNQIYRNVFDQTWIRRETEINWGFVIGTTGGVIALLAILALLYNSVWLANKQRNFELAFLQATSAEEQADALGGLASLRPLPFIGDATIYEQSVRELFFGMANWEQQKAIYDQHHFRENPDKLIRMIKIVYISMVDADESGHTTAMLAHMADNLESLKDEEVAILQQEIGQWVQGRTLAESGEFENALEAYDNAITINPNNPATLFERARILTELGNTSTDQTISADFYSLALTDLDRVVSLVLLQPEPEAGEILPTNTETQLPTATRTVEPTNTVISSSTSLIPITPPIKSTDDVTLVPTITIAPSSTIIPTQPPLPTPTPLPLPPRFNTRSQWLNLISNFLQNESALSSQLDTIENPEITYPNLLSSGLIELLPGTLAVETPLSTPVVTLLSTDTITPASLQNKIVFQSGRDGDFDIYIMNVDGSNQINLTNNSADDNYPVVSPDGTQVLFESIRDGNWEVYVMNIDGSQQRRLTDVASSSDRLPTWSPDGQQIAFISDRDGDYEIFIMNADGSNLRQITVNTLPEGHISWSVDNLLVYNAGSEGSRSWEIYTIDPDGNNQQQLTNNTISDWSPEWSPDGRFILYLSLVNSDPAIFVMNADGSNSHLLYNSPNYDWGADWTTDDQIIFTQDEANISAIYIMNADGTNIRKITERGSYPSWVR